jgi:hypothetical protein
MATDYETTFYTCYRQCESSKEECASSIESRENCAENNNVCIKKCDYIRGWDGRFWS